MYSAFYRNLLWYIDDVWEKGKDGEGDMDIVSKMPEKPKE